MLEKEFKWYLQHQNDLVKQYNGKFLLIKDENVVGAFDTNIEAYNKGKQKFEPGTFLIQKCTPGAQDYTQTFRSRVAFAK
jgi:hypothetical protein